MEESNNASKPLGPARPGREVRPPKREDGPRVRTRALAIGGVLVVLVLVGAGLWNWHEQPSFCNSVCHQPMDPYVEGYYSKDPGKLAAVHEGAEITCLDCHKPTIAQQAGEAASWLSGGYALPLEQRSFDDGFCLNPACHDLDRSDLAEATDHLKYNPHSDYHETLACGECHKAHEASVLECSRCHGDALIPDNWRVYGQR